MLWTFDDCSAPATMDTTGLQPMVLGSLAGLKQCPGKGGCTLQLDSRGCCTESDGCKANKTFSGAACDDPAKGSTATVPAWREGADFGGSSAVALSAWVYPTRNGVISQLFIRGYVYGGTDQVALSRGIAGTYNTSTTSMCMHFPCAGADCTGWEVVRRFCVSGGTIPLLQWTHVVGTLHLGQMSLYLNGARTASLHLPSEYQAAGLQSSSALSFVGSHPQWNQFDGGMDCVGLYNMVMSDDAVAALFQQQKDFCGCAVN